MINKNSSPTRSLLLKLLVIPFLAFLVLFFSTKTVGQVDPKKNQGIKKDSTSADPQIDNKAYVGFEIPASENGLSEEQLKEYEEIIKRNKGSEEKW